MSNKQIFVKFIHQTLAFDIKDTDTISDIKSKIQEIQPGITNEKQWLIFGGKLLDDDKLVSKYNTSKENPLHLVMKLE